jgi:hypothetical protein
LLAHRLGHRSGFHRGYSPFWAAIYRRIVSLDTLPIVEAKPGLPVPSDVLSLTSASSVEPSKGLSKRTVEGSEDERYERVPSEGSLWRNGHWRCNLCAVSPWQCWTTSCSSRRYSISGLASFVLLIA